MKYLIRIALCLFIYSSSFSQKQFPKGFVILNNGERADGFISLKSENKNPVRIRFSRDPSLKQEVTYNISDLKSFEITDVDRYIRANVLIDIRPFNSLVEIPAKTDSSRTETVWLRELLAGEHVSLYELFDTRTHYYISDSTGEFKELVYKVGRENDRPYELKKYIVQLQNYREKLQPQSTASFMKTKYAQYDLMKALDAINGNSSENAVLKRDLTIHYSVFAGAGAGMVKAKLKGVLETVGDLDFKNNIFPYGVVGIDFYPGRKPGVLTIRLDFTYNSADHKGTRMHPVFRETTYELRQKNFIPSVSALFNFVNKQNLKLYLGASASYTFSSYDVNEFVTAYPNENRVENFLEFRKTWLSIEARAGARINDTWEIMLRGEVAGKAERDKRYDFKARQYSLGVAYHFLRKL